MNKRTNLGDEILVNNERISSWSFSQFLKISWVAQLFRPLKIPRNLYGKKEIGSTDFSQRYSYSKWMVTNKKKWNKFWTFWSRWENLLRNGQANVGEDGTYHPETSFLSLCSDGYYVRQGGFYNGGFDAPSRM